ncbi:MAG: N-acetyltransferase protein [Candidatus Berkelbacteria bacterium]|nr:N-acetyltransferase protein [Candidatus Berkelbacteria bacterium]
MAIKIRLIKEDDIEEVAKIFMESFNTAAKKGWKKQPVEKYMKYWFAKRPDLFIVAEDMKILGGAVGEIKPLVGGNHLVDLQLFVDIKNQKQGIGKKLLKAIIEKAILQYNIVEVQGFADRTTDFPMQWYKRLGLKTTRWTHIEGKAKEIIKNI